MGKWGDQILRGSRMGGMEGEEGVENEVGKIWWRGGSRLSRMAGRLSNNRMRTNNVFLMSLDHVDAVDVVVTTGDEFGCRVDCVGCTIADVWHC